MLWKQKRDTYIFLPPLSASGRNISNIIGGTYRANFLRVSCENSKAILSVALAGDHVNHPEGRDDIGHHISLDQPLGAS